MAVWPTTLPGPLRTDSTITQGSTLVYRTVQSGRKEVRRFGSGAPDEITVVFRIFGATRIQTFEHFWDRTANLGINWFSADWLSYYGYTDHMARIIGYPERIAKNIHYSDYSVTLIVLESAYCWEDTTYGG